MNIIYLVLTVAVIGLVTVWYIKKKKPQVQETYVPMPEAPPTGNLEKVVKRMNETTNVHIVQHSKEKFCPTTYLFNDIMIVQHNGGEGNWIQRVTYKEAMVPLSSSEKKELNFKVNKIRRENQIQTQMRNDQVLQSL